jgi:hypothetical protein
MKYRKLVGYSLLIIGLFLVFWTVYSSYNIFTAKAEVPELFEMPQPEEKESPKDPQGQMEEVMGQMIAEQLKGLLPSDFLVKLFNLIAWSIFATFAVFAGTQVSGLGIKLIKD